MLKPCRRGVEQHACYCFCMWQKDVLKQFFVLHVADPAISQHQVFSVTANISTQPVFQTPIPSSASPIPPLCVCLGRAVCSCGWWEHHSASGLAPES